jgi:hypothetical protein
MNTIYIFVKSPINLPLVKEINGIFTAILIFDGLILILIIQFYYFYFKIKSINISNWLTDLLNEFYVLL